MGGTEKNLDQLRMVTKAPSANFLLRPIYQEQVMQDKLNNKLLIHEIPSK